MKTSYLKPHIPYLPTIPEEPSFNIDMSIPKLRSRMMKQQMLTMKQPTAKDIALSKLVYATDRLHQSRRQLKQYKIK